MKSSARFPGLLLFACAVLAAESAEARAPARTYSVRISQRDSALIATRACASAGSPGADRIDASRRKETGPISAEVQCIPHTTVESFPVVHYTTCSNGSGAWRCAAGHDAIHVKLSNAAVVPVVAQGVSAHAAITAVNEASKLLVPPFHKPAIELLKGSCTVAPHGSTPSPEMQLFDIRCDSAYMLLTAHCWQAGCRYFIPQGEGY